MGSWFRAMLCRRSWSCLPPPPQFPVPCKGNTSLSTASPVCRRLFLQRCFCWDGSLHGNLQSHEKCTSGLVKFHIQYSLLSHSVFFGIFFKMLIALDLIDPRSDAYTLGHESNHQYFLCPFLVLVNFSIIPRQKRQLHPLQITICLWATFRLQFV